MIAALCLALLLQATPPPLAVKPGMIRGHVTAADTGKPLRRASITVRSATEGGTVRLSGSTNSLGQFEIKDVPPGAYFVTAARSGYLSLQFGQRRSNERGLTVEVAEGATADKVEVTLPRAGVLAGRIVDELGEPFPGVEVTALTMRYVNGQRVSAPAGGARTDDLGQFRIAGVAPGSYTIVAITTETWRTDRQETFGYASTYYPGVAADAAQRITIGPAVQRTDLDFTMRPSRAVRVSGHAQAEPAAPAPTGAQLAYRLGDGILSSGFRTARVTGDGSFEFADVTEGIYLLSGTGTFDETVTVRDTDVAGLTLTTRRGSTITGTIVGEDDAPPPFRSAGVRISLMAPTDRVLPTVRIISPEASWNFTMQGLGGPFLFRVLGLPDGWALGAVRLGDRDITDVPFDVPTGGKQIDGLKIVLTQKAGKVTGTIVDAAGKRTSGATLIVFADDEKLWMPGSRFVRSIRPKADGTFAVTGLPAGTYRAIAREAVEDGQWEDPAFLESIRDQAARISLGEGATESLVLTLAPPK